MRGSGRSWHRPCGRARGGMVCRLCLTDDRCIMIYKRLILLYAFGVYQVGEREGQCRLRSWLCSLAQVGSFFSDDATGVHTCVCTVLSCLHRVVIHMSLARGLTHVLLLSPPSLLGTMRGRGKLGGGRSGDGSRGVCVAEGRVIGLCAYDSLCTYMCVSYVWL